MATTGARSDTGREREGNEDRYLTHEERGMTLLAVADGVGGSSGGEVAADAAIHELATRFFASPGDSEMSEALTGAIREANSAVISAAESSGHRDAASTLVAAAIRRDQAVVANLGDSRAYIVRDSRIRQLTEDHSGTMRHAITRFVGDPRGVQPDVFVETLRAGDRIVLCSDGLTRHVSPEEIATVVAGRDVQSAANALVDLANARGGEDNVTVVLYAARSSALVQRPLALGVFAALALLVVGGAIAVLLSTNTVAPAPTPSPVPSSAPTETPSPSPTDTPSASPAATPNPSPTASP